MNDLNVSKPYIIFVSLLFILLSIYPFHVLFLYPLFQFLSIFVPFNAAYLVIPSAILFYAVIMYIIFYGKRHILCWLERELIFKIFIASHESRRLWWSQAKTYIFQWHWTSFTYIEYQNAVSDPSSNAMLSIAMGRVSFMVCTFEICNISNSSVPKTQWSTQKASISSKPFLNVNYVIWFNIEYRIIRSTSRTNVWECLLLIISKLDHPHLYWLFVYQH